MCCTNNHEDGDGTFTWLLFMQGNVNTKGPSSSMIFMSNFIGSCIHADLAILSHTAG
jgi:hypothetical protein